jgi:hypothetical protein
MFGWRWNTTLQVFDLNTYAHVSGDRFMGGPALTVPPDGVFYVWLEIDYTAGYVRLNFMAGPVHRVEFVNLREMPRWNREIGAWFGGNRETPKRMELWKERIWAYVEEDGITKPDTRIHAT